MKRRIAVIVMVCGVLGVVAAFAAGGGSVWVAEGTYAGDRTGTDSDGSLLDYDHREVRAAQASRAASRTPVSAMGWPTSVASWTSSRRRSS